jgi:DNA-binding transcriptional ArsR family regulator
MVDRFSAVVLDALGDANRRAILEVLAEEPRCVGAIADRLPISRPAVSRHLRVLREAGLVDDEPDGTRRNYRLRPDGIVAVRAYFEQLWGDAIARYQLTAENVGQRDPR